MRGDFLKPVVPNTVRAHYLSLLAKGESKQLMRYFKRWMIKHNAIETHLPCKRAKYN